MSKSHYRRWHYPRSFKETDIGDLVQVWDTKEKNGPLHWAKVTEKADSGDMLLSFRKLEEPKLPWLTINQYGCPWRWRVMKKSENNPLAPLDEDRE